nr:hypothetical protein [Tanacetum cinerariifolium]
MQTQTSNTLHNAIMEAGSKGCPPMLAHGNYVQWKSRIKRYIDTKPNHELIHYCLENPPYELDWKDKAVPDSDGIPTTTTERVFETYKNVTLKQGDQLMSKILKPIGIGNLENSHLKMPEWQRFVTLVKQSQELKTVSYHKLYDILKQHQHEVNEIKAEKIAHVANPLTLVAQQQPVYHPQTHPTHYTQNSSTRSQQAATRNRGKAIEFRHVARECQKLKRAKDAAYHREKMLLCKQEEAKIQLNAEQADCKDDTDDELEDRELEAHYMYMAQLQEVSPDTADSGPIFDDEPLQKVSNNDHYNVFAMESVHPEQSESIHDTYPIEQNAQNVIIDSLDMSNDREEIDQNDDDNDLAKEQLARRDSKEYASQMELECAKVRGDLLSYKMDYQKSCTKYTKMINDLNQMISELKDKLSVHQDTISILSQQKEAQSKLYKNREDKELEKVIELENKVKVLDNIVFKTVQSVQTMNMLNNKCRMSFAKPKILKKAKRANPRLYDIGCYNDNLALMLAPESDEVIRIEKESQPKLSDLIKPFDYTKLNNSYDLFVPQREKSSEQRYFSERSRMSHINVQNEKRKSLLTNKQLC